AAHPTQVPSAPSLRPLRPASTPPSHDRSAHHPPHPRLPPSQAPLSPRSTIISITNLNHMTAALRRAYRAGATSQRLPVYVTEYGIESYPEVEFGVTPQRQAEYPGIAEYLLYRNPWVPSSAPSLTD